MKDRVYEPYVAALAEAERTSAPHLQGQQTETIRKPVEANLGERLLNMLRKLRITAYRGLDIVTGRAIAVR
jgi:hypothetical protein